jgi:hypothetical protein
MYEVYFSHSYRDEQINNYFIRLFAEQDIRLLADRKSETWCVPKLEKYLTYARGFVAVVPQREAADAVYNVSPYIATELTFARRARIPRLIFVEDTLTADFHHITPDDVVPFLRQAPQADINDHRRTIAEFRTRIQQEGTWSRSPRIGSRRASVFLGEQSQQTDVAPVLQEILLAEAFRPQLIAYPDFGNCANDMSALDNILTSEISVYCLQQQCTQVDLALAVAHALCLPAFRLRHDPQSTVSDPDLQGILRWPTLEQLRRLFQEQLRSYRHGFVEVIPLPTNPVMKDLVLPDWDASNPLSLLQYVQVDDPHLRQDLNLVRQQVGSFFGAVSTGRYDELCRAVYQQVRGYGWLYDFELGGKDYTRQRIRSPREMHADTAGTCLDFACFFGALLEAMQANPVVVRLCWEGGAHALAGCWVNNRPGQVLIRQKSVVLDAVTKGDLLLLETTGAARNDTHVPGALERMGGFLSYKDSIAEARRCLEQDKVDLDFLLDILAGR